MSTLTLTQPHEGINVADLRVVRSHETACQREFMEAVLFRPDIRNVGCGGRRGGGKTRICCEAVLLRALMYENTEHLCIRRVQKAADLNLGREFKKVMLAWGLPLGEGRRGQIHWYTKDKLFEFPNGSIIELGFCAKENDWERYQGREAATVWIAEATQFPEIAFQLIGGSSRSVTNPRCPAKRLIDCNPGGQGNNWVERMFVNPNTRAPRTAWIPMGIRDSLAVLENDPGYVLRTLRGLPDWLRRQWEEGDFMAVAGQYWNLPPDSIRLITAAQLPRGVDWYAGVDWGRAKPFCVLYMARWQDWHQETIDGVQRWVPRDRAHIFREVYQAELDFDEQARLVLDTEKTLPLNGRSVLYFADPATGKPLETLSTEAGKTIRDVWNAFGWFCHPALSNARVPGWNLVKMLFRHGVLTISPDCVALLNEMRQAVAEGSPGPPISEDIQQGQHVDDHAMDALRYLALSTFGLNYTIEGRDPYAQPGAYPPG